MRRTFTVVDIVEIRIHWYAGRSRAQISRSLGVDRKTVHKYTRTAIDAGLVPGGPAITEEKWRVKVRTRFPALYDTRLSRPPSPGDRPASRDDQDPGRGGAGVGDPPAPDRRVRPGGIGGPACAVT
jgi:hypothetical protein